MINVLGIGLDYLMLKKDNVRGPVIERQLQYAKQLTSLTLIVYSPRYLNLKSEKWAENLEIIPTNSLSKATFILDAIRIGIRICKNKKIDVITTEEPFTTGLVGFILKKLFNIPFNVQTRIDFCNNYFWVNERLINRFFNALGKFVTTRADSLKLLTSNEKIKFEKLGIPSKKMFVIPTQCRIDRFSSGDGSNIRSKYLGMKFEKLILFVGRLVGQKDIPTLFKAFREVLKVCPKTLLMIIGDGPLRSQLSRVTKQLKLDENVYFLGSVPHNQLADYYAGCDVFALPSIYEGICIVIAEAMAVGKPVVSTEIAGAKDLMKDGETGFIIKQKDYASMAEKIIFLLENEKIAKEMGERGKKHINTLFSDEKNVNGVISLWEKTAALKLA